VRLARVAWFANEGEILQFGRGAGGGDSKAKASERLRLLGYDGMSDLYDGRHTPSFAALSADVVTIVEVYAV
jgi:hypothetical protein